MSDLEKIPAHLQHQYTGAYGPFVSGDYAPGDQIPGEGEVIWSYLSEESGIIYVCSACGAWPVEVAASEIRQAK